MQHIFTNRVTRATLLASLTLAVAGCGGGGGGGGGGGSSPPPPANTATVTGSVQAANAAGLTGVGGYTVVFDNIASVSAVTSGSGSSLGQFTLSVPNADITGNDTITVKDASGTAVVPNVPVVVTASGTTAVPAILLPPPAPAARK